MTTHLRSSIFLHPKALLRSINHISGLIIKLFDSCVTVETVLARLGFHVSFNSISVISGRWENENKSLCTMEPHLQFGLVNRVLILHVPPKIKFCYIFNRMHVP